MKQRLDHLLVELGLVPTRSQAESWIKLGMVTVDDKPIKKPGFFANPKSKVRLSAKDQYVSRAGLKLASVASVLSINFKDKLVLDVGSSTGGFTDYALQHGARKVYAVDVGTNQLHPSLHGNAKIELHEKTDIRDFIPDEIPDVIVMDVSFISSRQILPHLANVGGTNTDIYLMLKPQFEAQRQQINSKGIVKNNSIRRDIIKDFELWSRQYFVICSKADSLVAGATGNVERFYHLKITTRR